MNPIQNTFSSGCGNHGASSPKKHMLVALLEVAKK